MNFIIDGSYLFIYNSNTVQLNIEVHSYLSLFFDNFFCQNVYVL